MPIPQTYYLNAPSLASATAIFLDPSLTVCAPDGIYSDGVITREQISCVLYPQVPCPTCGIVCGQYSPIIGGSGYYNVNINAGSTTGAIIIRFKPFDIPTGIQALFNSTVYNRFSSAAFELTPSAPGVPIYLGNLANDCGLVAGSPFILNKYIYSGSTFIPTGSTQSVSIAASQLKLTAGNPDRCIMVIPKTSASPTDLQFTIIGPCENDSFNLAVNCPIKLPSFNSTAAGELNALCSMTIDSLFFSAPVNGDGYTLGLYDFVFLDENGEFPLPDGYYRCPAHLTSPNDSIKVTNGIIVSIFQNCL